MIQKIIYSLQILAFYKNPFSLESFNILFMFLGQNYNASYLRNTIFSNTPSKQIKIILHLLREIPASSTYLQLEPKHHTVLAILKHFFPVLNLIVRSRIGIVRHISKLHGSSFGFRTITLGHCRCFNEVPSRETIQSLFQVGVFLYFLNFIEGTIHVIIQIAIAYRWIEKHFFGALFWNFFAVYATVVFGTVRFVREVLVL